MQTDWRDVQRRLAALGFDPGPPDGVVGTRTLSAIWRWKVAIGLDPNLPFGPVSLARLMAATNSPSSASPPPPWIVLAAQFIGRHERRDNQALRAFLRSDGDTLGDPAALPWCGDFVETVMRKALPDEPLPGALGQNPYWARNWLLYGVPVPPIQFSIGVFARGSGGHVGWLLGTQGSYYRVLGGNQSDAVTDSALLHRDRLLGSRWPGGYAQPFPFLPELSGGGTISYNEV